MDTKIEIKEEDPLSDSVASLNERELSHEIVTVKRNSDVELPENDCDVALISETPSTKPVLKQIKFESNSWEVIRKPETEQQTLVSDLGLQNDGAFLPEDPIVKYNSDHEMDNKIDIKEEPCCLETVISAVSDDIKVRDFPSVKSPRQSTIRCSNNCEMDTKVEVKEEDLVSNDMTSLNERAFFHEVVTEKRNSDVLLDDDCDVAIKSETPFAKHLKSETVKQKKTEVEEETLISDFSSYNKGEFLPEEPVMKYNNDHEMNNKIEIKEEPWWLKTETSLVCGDVKDGDFPVAESSRVCMETASGISSGKTPLPATEVSGKDTSFGYGNDHLECQQQKSDVTEMPTAEKHLSEQSSKCTDHKEMYTYLKQNSSIDKGKQAHKCNVCAQDFSYLSQLKRHNLIHEGRKPYQCKTCDKRFSRLSHLEAHNLIHEGKKAHQCKICGKRFTRLSDLKKHNLIHEGRKLHQCKTCDKKFTRLSQLQEHNLIHEGKKPHHCKTCDKSFTRLSDLKTHNLIHEGKKPHQCKTCDKKFTQLSNLKRHNLIHDGKKPHQCKTCDRTFTQFTHLKAHNLIHEGRRPHQCKTCDKSFTQLSSLKAHNLIHEGKKPHQCKTCDKSFTQLSNLKTHNLIHEGKKLH